jgi:hypothetical protein
MRERKVDMKKQLEGLSITARSMSRWGRAAAILVIMLSTMSFIGGRVNAVLDDAHDFRAHTSLSLRSGVIDMSVPKRSEPMPLSRREASVHIHGSELQGHHCTHRF